MELIRLLIMAVSFLGVFLCSSNIIKFNAACNPREREALINLKHNFNDPNDRLSSWVGKDCCKWQGVICKKKTESDGNDWVVQLQLSNFWLGGGLNSSLLELKHLYHLDLSANYLGIQIPSLLGSLQNLRYLDLSYNGLEGEIPKTLGNLCNLEVLDLSDNKLQGEISSILFRNSSRCFANKLKSLHLGYNLLAGQLPDELVTLKNLEELSLRGNSFSGSIPMSIGRLSLLRVLELSHNNLNGSIPMSIGRLSLLRVLYLSHNKLNGSLPEIFWNLSSLEQLTISNNMLEGDVTEADFANLKELKILDVSSIFLNLSPDWIPPFRLQYLLLTNCSVENQFPGWLRTQKDLVHVDMTNARLSGSVPSWFWNMTSQLNYLDISHNQLEGDLSNVLLNSSKYGVINLNSNRFTGNLPLISSHVGTLDLSRNYLWGPISVLLCNPAEDVNALGYLDLSENQLSGLLPDCWSPWRSLAVIRFKSNNITGNVPSSMGLLSKLSILHLQNNALHGELPSSLQNCTELMLIDLGENRLTGAIPTWTGENQMNKLRVLRLHSNKFHGEIPRKLCYPITLQILDLGHNNLSGTIPKCFSNFSSLASNFELRNLSIYEANDAIDFVAKGKDMAYGQDLLVLVVGIDLSNNNLYGEIPEELTYLFRLEILNLANNSFTGGIPKGIGHLHSLESLDLSNNRLSGSIPQSLVNLTFLSYLNLSYNNLSGEIPLGTQLQTFSELSYIGNNNLCGVPLDKCDKDEQRQKAPNGDGEGSMDDDEEEDWIEMKWFYMGLPFGFVVGFWCSWGVLLVKKSWRYAYFRFLDDIIYKLSTCVK